MSRIEALDTVSLLCKPRMNDLFVMQDISSLNEIEMLHVAKVYVFF